MCRLNAPMFNAACSAFETILYGLQPGYVSMRATVWSDSLFLQDSIWQDATFPAHNFFFHELLYDIMLRHSVPSAI